MKSTWAQPNIFPDPDGDSSSTCRTKTTSNHAKIRFRESLTSSPVTPSCTCAAEDLRDGPRSSPAQGPGVPLSFLMYVRCVLGGRLPPEARLNSLSAVFAACQTACFTGFISGGGFDETESHQTSPGRLWRCQRLPFSFSPSRATCAVDVLENDAGFGGRARRGRRRTAPVKAVYVSQDIFQINDAGKTRAFPWSLLLAFAYFSSNFICRQSLNDVALKRDIDASALLFVENWETNGFSHKRGTEIPLTEDEALAAERTSGDASYKKGNERLISFSLKESSSLFS
ncbi:uncharacterized protein V6R79_025747 [Siganus canaliculatus]